MHSRDAWLALTFGAFLLYAALGAVLFRLWIRRRRVRRPASVSADPVGALAYWLPLLIYAEAYSLGSLPFTAALLLVALSVDRGYTLIAIVISLVFFVFFFIGVDIFWVRRVQHLARKRSASAEV